MYRQTIISTALAHLGQRNLYPYAWCAKFVSQVYKEAGLSPYWYDGRTSLSCTTVLNWYKKNYHDQVHDNLDAMRPGDIVFFNFKNNGKPNHVGIFDQKLSTTGFTTIEGNTSGPSGGSEYNGNTVAEKVRYMSKVFAFVHIIFPDENPYPEPSRTIGRGAKGNDVKWVQYYLVQLGYNIAIDGKFGPASEQALRQAQTALSLVSDGKCGKQTRTKLKGVFEHDY